MRFALNRSSGHDFHCHLDLYRDIDAVRRDIDDHQILTLGMTTTPRAYAKNMDLFSDSPFIMVGLGLHPELAATREADLQRFATLLTGARVVGEIGLDGRIQNRSSLPLQELVLSEILSIARNDAPKLISFHSPRAVTRVLDAIEVHIADSGHTKILHWFTGSAKETRRAVDLGCYFSINSAMFANEAGLSRIRSFPRSRVLTETDGPLIMDGPAPVLPSRVLNLQTQLARLWDVNVGIARSQLTENARGALETILQY